MIFVIDKRIGKRIKECREKLGMTQEDFSEKTKFSVNYISMVERGGSFPEMRTADYDYKYLGCFG